MSQKRNTFTRRRLILYIIGMVVFGGILVFVQYSTIGTAADSSGAVIGTSLYTEDDIIGTWGVTNGKDDIFGVKYTEEVFEADGSWRSGAYDSILNEGRWTLKNDMIEVHQTKISVGSTYESTNRFISYSIISITADHMEIKSGEKSLIFQRKK